MRHLGRMRRLARAGAPRRGMTLIEIMVVMLLLGLIATAITVAVIPQLSCGKQRKALLDMTTLKGLLDMYKAKTGKYPSTGEGLQVLVSAKLTERLSKDPWDNDYVYLYENGKVSLMSYGNDKVSGGEDENADLNSNMVKAPCDEVK